MYLTSRYVLERKTPGRLYRTKPKRAEPGRLQWSGALCTYHLPRWVLTLCRMSLFSEKGRANDCGPESSLCEGLTVRMAEPGMVRPAPCVLS
jgi:hypothetical protein